MDEVVYCYDDIEYHQEPSQWEKDYIEKVGDDTIGPSVWSTPSVGRRMKVLGSPVARFAILWVTLTCVLSLVALAVIG